MRRPDRLDRAPLTALTPRTITDRDALHDELTRVCGHAAGPRPRRAGSAGRRRPPGSASEGKADMPVTDIEAKARALYDARRNRRAIAPFTDADPTLGMADGYAVQAELTRLILADGDTSSATRSG